MKVEIQIDASSKKKLIKELKEIAIQIQEEINSPLCKDCTDCKDNRKSCFVVGGSSETGLESDWKLNRPFKEHKNICKSKNRK